MRVSSSLAARALGVAALTISGLAFAGGEAITLPQALARALRNHPGLASAEAMLRAQSARVTEAGLPQSASADFLVEDAGGTGDRDGFSAAQTTLSLSHVIEFGGKRQGRVTVAEAEHSVLRTQQNIRRLDIAAEVARRFISTLQAQEQLALADGELEGARATADAIEKRVRHAQALPAESARAQVALERGKLEVEHAQHELKGAQQFLAAAMGERSVDFGRSAGTLLALDATIPIETLLERIESTADFLLFADEMRVHDAALRLAELRRRPDVRAQLGVRHYGDGDDFALMAGVSVPLGWRRRAMSGIEVARAERAQIDSEREAALLAARAQLFDQYQELEHARLETDVLRDTIIPRLTDALAKSEYAYQRGRYSYLEWTSVRSELFAARRRLNEVAAKFHTLRVEIERLSGQPAALEGARP